MKTLAILTNGGDTCALNASIKSIRDNAYQAGFKKIYGVKRGYQGLLDETLIDITHREIDPRIGGSFLGSMRTSPTTFAETGGKNDSIYVADDKPGEDGSPSVCARMAQCLDSNKVDVLVVIGGNGTLQSTKMFKDWYQASAETKKLRPLEIMGFLKTIDNDIRTYTEFEDVEVSLCPGFPSAVSKIVRTIEDLRATVQTSERAFAVEIMGRDAGWLAAAATFGGAEILVYPELIEYSKTLDVYNQYRSKSPEDFNKIVTEDTIKLLVNEIEDIYRRNRNIIIAVGEGFEPAIKIKRLQDFVKTLRGLYGPRRKVGATELIALLVSPALEHYFKCLSDLCSAERNFSCLDEEIDYIVNKEYIEIQKQTKMKEGVNTDPEDKLKLYFEDDDHPLKDWHGKEKITELLREVGEHKDSKITIPLMGTPPYMFEMRPHRTDYTPRSGSSSSYDYRLATVLGQKIGQMLLNKEFGSVPALDKIVPYDELVLDRVKTVAIDDISTLLFNRKEYIDKENRFQVSDLITNYFRTITSGPDDLDEAIHDFPSVQK